MAEELEKEEAEGDLLMAFDMDSDSIENGVYFDA